MSATDFASVLSTEPSSSHPAWASPTVVVKQCFLSNSFCIWSWRCSNSIPISSLFPPDVELDVDVDELELLLELRRLLPERCKPIEFKKWSCVKSTFSSGFLLIASDSTIFIISLNLQLVLLFACSDFIFDVSQSDCVLTTISIKPVFEIASEATSAAPPRANSKCAKQFCGTPFVGINPFSVIFSEKNMIPVKNPLHINREFGRITCHMFCLMNNWLCTAFPCPLSTFAPSCSLLHHVVFDHAFGKYIVLTPTPLNRCQIQCINSIIRNMFSTRLYSIATSISSQCWKVPVSGRRWFRKTIHVFYGLAKIMS